MSAVRPPLNLPINGERLSRVICVAVVAAAHILLLCFLAFDIKVAQILPDPPVAVMKLVDIEEYAPPPPPPPAVMPPIQNTVETIAEEIIGVEELDPPTEMIAPVVTENDAEADTGNVVGVSPGQDYLPSHRVPVPPQFDENELKGRIVYPPIARRSGIEGNVILDLFIDREGYVRNIIVLKETPEGRGFAEAAVKAFQGLKATQAAQANGENVGVRYRRLVRFTLR